ncbi:hypothetical protein ccbrp13_62530 [Ktedonobacteria bacterium brp13]|nr:hypothetical protein ccbrp13_62530 [Ktedonobacteria bacterium brp13]
MAKKGTKPTEILLQAKKRSQKKSAESYYRVRFPMTQRDMRITRIRIILIKISGSVSSGEKPAPNTRDVHQV